MIKHFGEQLSLANLLSYYWEGEMIKHFGEGKEHSMI